MSLVEIMKPDFTFEDDRGTLIQLVREGWKQVNVVTSVGSAERGGHFHARNTEAFYVVSGSFEVTLKKDGESETHSFSGGDMFKILPGVIHSFTYFEDSVLVVLYDSGVENPDGSKDIIASE